MQPLQRSWPTPMRGQHQTSTRANYTLNGLSSFAIGCDPTGMALPAAGATVASYLIHLALDGTSLPQIKAAASAIAWFHDCGGHYLDACYIQAALAVAAKLLSPDDGGGEPLPARS